MLQLKINFVPYLNYTYELIFKKNKIIQVAREKKKKGQKTGKYRESSPNNHTFLVP